MRSPARRTLVFAPRDANIYLLVLVVFFLGVFVLAVPQSLTAEPGTTVEPGIATEPAGTTDFATRKVIIDSDPGMGYLFRDIDDGLMLIAALGSPELEIVGITTTFGNVTQRRANAKGKEIVRLLRENGPPVVPGARGPMGDDGKTTEDGQTTHASEFIADAVTAHPGEITILATGPLTNVAQALRHDPGIADQIKEIIVVGGHMETEDVDSSRMPYDMNFGSDVEAARTVIESDIPLTLIHIALCLDFMTTKGQFTELIDSAGELSSYLYAETRSWHFIKGGRIVLWDVVALNYLLRPEWYETRTSGVRLDVRKYLRTVVKVETDESSPFKAKIPMRIHDRDAYWRWLQRRLAVGGVLAAQSR